MDTAAALSASAAVAVAAAAAVVKATTDRASTTLFALCDASYANKNIKREKKKKTDPSIEEKTKESAPKSYKNSNKNHNNYGSSSSQGEKKEVDMGPRVEIINGKIVVRESSLMVDEDDNNGDYDYEEVEEGNHATATYSSFLKTRHSFSWGIEETRQFYLVILSTFIYIILGDLFFYVCMYVCMCTYIYVL
jgi:hypothetical protein